MRIRMTSITKVLPALLILAMTASSQAQTESQDGLSSNDDRQVRSSRYRFVPTPSKLATPPSHRVASLVPAKDLSTAPSRFYPTVDKTAFQTPVINEVYDRPDFETPAPTSSLTASNDNQSSQAVATQPSNQPIYVAGMAPTQVIANDMYFAPAQAQPYVPKHRNFFGVSECDCCDEWEGFIACGGLKANPGHYGQPFIVGCDPCEPPCGRCEKCLAKRKQSKQACDGGCDECESGCKAKHGHKARKENRKSDCGCDSCASTGILSWLK